MLTCFLYNLLFNVKVQLSVNTFSSLTQSQVQEGTFAACPIRSKPKHIPLTLVTDQERSWETRGMGQGEGIINPNLQDDASWK